MPTPKALSKPKLRAMPKLGGRPLPPGAVPPWKWKKGPTPPDTAPPEHLLNPPEANNDEDEGELDLDCEESGEESAAEVDEELAVEEADGVAAKGGGKGGRLQAVPALELDEDKDDYQPTEDDFFSCECGGKQFEALSGGVVGDRGHRLLSALRCTTCRCYMKPYCVRAD